MRGGAVRWRTKTLPNGETIKIAVVRKAGPEGGHTVAGEPAKPKKSTKKSTKKKGER